MGVQMCKVLSTSCGVMLIFVASRFSSIGYLSKSSCLVNAVSPPNFSTN